MLGHHGPVFFLWYPLPGQVWVLWDLACAGLAELLAGAGRTTASWHGHLACGNRDGAPEGWKSRCLLCCGEDNALLRPEPCGADGSNSSAPHPASGHRSFPSMGQRLTSLCGSLIRPPSFPAGISRDGFLPSPGCHCVPTFDQESAFLKCSISHMLL